jgi:hypothetical protein
VLSCYEAGRDGFWLHDPLAFETFQLPMQVPGVFFFHARHAHYAPAAALR